MRWRISTYRGGRPERWWLPIGRALDTRGRIRGLSFCWGTGMWAFWVERRHPPRPRTFGQQLLDDAKRMVPIDTGYLRAQFEPYTDPVGYAAAYEVGQPSPGYTEQPPGGLTPARRTARFSTRSPDPERPA